MYDGWLTTFGTEIVNHARLMAYRDALLPSLDLKNCTPCGDLIGALDDEPYDTPTTDDAPWVDIDTPGSTEFLGWMCTGAEGFEDSTREANTIESLFDGGTVGRVRRKTREMRVTLVGFGVTQMAVSAGFGWLKSALNGNLCDTCDDSDDICFFTACPPEGADGDAFVRHLRRAKCTDGPHVLAERPMNTCGGWMMQVEFTLTAGSPYIFGEPIGIASASGSELTAVLPGAETFPMAIPLETCWNWLDKPKSGVLRDPDCPPVPRPPTVPALTSACKPLVFSTYAYRPTQKFSAIRFNQYESRPLVARGAGVWLSVYAHGPVKNITADTKLMGKTSTDSGATWSGEFTVHDDLTANRGLEPAGITWAPDLGKFILGVNNLNVVTGTRKGEILTSSTGLSGSWSVASNLETVMKKWGSIDYHLTDVEHHENGTTAGITYAACSARKKGMTKPIVVLLRSLDGAATWQVISTPWAAVTANSYTYPQIAIWPSGEIGLFTLVPEHRQIFFRRSTNGGKAWTAGVVAATAASGIPAPVVTNDGGVMFMYRDMRRPGARGLGQHNYRYSKDHGRRWFPGSGLFAKNSTNGQIGADWAVASNGDLGVVFALDYSNTVARVYWTSFWQIENFTSYAITVPNSALRAWADGVLMLQIKTGSQATRQMRVRLIPRPLDTQLPEDLDPCSVCSEFVIDYAPANTVIYLDGMTERVTMRVGNGVPQPADHLVSGPNGSVFSWPTFACGLGYFVLVDVDVKTVTSLALAVANRE